MRKQIKKQAVRKIKSNSGASILIALLVFLIAAMTGSVILTSATVSSGAVNRSLQQYQDMSTLKSTANILIDEFGKSVPIEDGKEPVGNNDALSSQGFQTVQQYMGQYVNFHDDTCTYNIDSIKLSSSAENADKAQNVKGKITMDTNYSVSIDLWIDDSKNTKDRSHLYIRFNGDPMDGEPTEETDENGQVTTTFNISQKDGVVTTVNVKEADDNETGN